eukprot:TRINITY_DN107_c0_g4_i1.p1 TRINITY_DN107_c0_g4~~TRINITY_DN107_c0_g4_i1.p1  ORF type:complete len:1061 (+),score=256.46 TRINITY_DN107_c0_g4_i1:70-3252(+)
MLQVPRFVWSRFSASPVRYTSGYTRRLLFFLFRVISAFFQLFVPHRTSSPLHTMPVEAASGLWRSEDMQLLRITVPRDVAYGMVTELGTSSLAQFVDLNEDVPPFHRPYTAEIRRCDELDRKLRGFQTALAGCKLSSAPPDPALTSPASGATADLGLNFGGVHGAGSPSSSGAPQIEQLENIVGATEARLAETTAQTRDLIGNINRCLQMIAFFSMPQDFHCHPAATITDEGAPSPHPGTTGGLSPSTGTPRPDYGSFGSTRPSGGAAGADYEKDRESRSGLRAVAGVISASDLVYLQRAVFRLSRGNFHIVTAPLRVPPPALSGAGGTAGTDSGPGFAFGAHSGAGGGWDAGGGTVWADHDWAGDSSGGSAPESFGGEEGVAGVAESATGKLRRGVIVDPDTMQPEDLVVFTLYFGAARLGAAIRRLLGPMHARMLRLEPSEETRRTQMVETWAQATMLLRALEKAEGAKRDTVLAVRERAQTWAAAVGRVRAVATALNSVEYLGQTAHAVVWVPTTHVDAAHAALERAQAAAGVRVGAVVAPVPIAGRTIPTYFRTNRFTEQFQAIVDSYGTARYKEVNPGVLTIVTFPFLFGVMYGDLGHGVMMMLMALMMVLNEKRIGNGGGEIFQMIFQGRYLVLLMSMFGTYMGVLYNDMFSLSIAPFGRSQYQPHGRGGGVQFYRPIENVNPYPFGIDPNWAGAQNKLDTLNSVKMKMAVILGVAHMTAGLVLSYLNYRRKRDVVRIVTVFIPEMLFLLLTFGYMDFLIVLKWLRPGSMPSILDMMTNFFLSPGQQPPTVSEPLYFGQFRLQGLLLLIAVVAVPVLLLGVPCHEKRRRAGKQRRRSLLGAARGGYHTFDDAPHAFADDVELADRRSERSVEDRPPPPQAVLVDPEHERDTLRQREGHQEAGPGMDSFDLADDASGEHEEEFGEIVIHQVIHTIEYVLGCVSNTASYLRLWALSLAHAQLAEVFWGFTVEGGIKIGNSPYVTGAVMVVAFAVWFAITLGVLLGMEGLSAFLHALRLHWVEFQSKFYAGDGVAFVPLNLAAVAAAAATSVAGVGA